MKKKNILFITIISSLIFSLVGCANNTKNTISNPNENEGKIEIDESNMTIEERFDKAVSEIDIETYLTPTYENIIPITPNEALEKKANGETFIVFHGRSDCRYCKYVYPGTSEVLPEGMTIYYVNTDWFRYLYPDDDQDPLYEYVKEKHDYYKEEFDFTGVPNFKYIKDGKLELTLMNPLSGDFFEDSATKEQRELLLQDMKDIIIYNLEYMQNDMSNGVSNQEPQVTIEKNF